MQILLRVLAKLELDMVSHGVTIMYSSTLELFDILTANIDVVQDPEVVTWAILYHDAVYDPMSTRGRNEELSARLGEHDLPSLVGAEKSRLVARYTRATADHGVDDSDQDLDFFLDADLAILGASPDRYDRYANDIRREYSHVPIENYIVGRIAILQSLATRVEQSGLYITELFKATYEDQAQENIAREADQLRRATQGV
jgi:predicted metal-dependent HD superfamily phosphohydrolase